MTDKAFRAKVDDMGGVVTYPMQSLHFPRKFRINSKEEAIDLLDVLTARKGYTISIDKPLQALKAAIKKGLI